MNPSPGPARRRVLNRSQATLVRRLFSEILHRDLDPLIVHLLVFGLILLAALRAAMEELDHIRELPRNTPMWLALLDYPCFGEPADPRLRRGGGGWPWGPWPNGGSV